MSKKQCCMVCGAAVEQTTTVCDRCGLPQHMLFAGEDSIAAWKEKTKLLRRDWLKRYRSEYELIVGDDCIALVERKKAHIRICDTAGVQEQSGIGFSASEHHRVLLHQDGTVKCSGSDAFGQCRTDSIQNVISVLATERSTWVVHEDGSVSVCGAADFPKALHWSGMKLLRADSGLLLGLRTNGTVLCTGDKTEQAVMAELQTWRDIADIHTAGGAVLAQKTDGTIVFAGRNGDVRAKAVNWTDCIAVSMDSGYAVGLTADGHIRLAGSRLSMLECGRTAAADWKNITMIACGHCAIAGIRTDGGLAAAGNLIGLNEIINGWNRYPEQ